MTREERIQAAHLAEMRYCLNYLDLRQVKFNPETDEGKRCATALDVLSKPCSLEEQAVATVICLLNREALHDTIMHFVGLIERGHPRHEAAPVVILVLEVMCNAEKYAELVEKYNYKNVKKFATDIRFKLSFFVDMVDHFYLFDRTLREFSDGVRMVLARESLCGHQISKCIRPISESIIDELEVYYEDDNCMDINILKYETYSQEKRWEYVSQHKRRVMDDSNSDPLYCYALKTVEEQFYPVYNESGDIYHNLGWKLIGDETEKYNKHVALILLYFNEADRETYLLNEHRKLQTRKGNRTLVTPLPFAFLELYQSVHTPFDTTLERNGLSHMEIYHFRDLVSDFIEKYFYLKGCDDYGVDVDMDCLRRTSESYFDLFHSIPWFKLTLGVSSTEQYLFNDVSWEIEYTARLSAMEYKGFLTIPDRFTMNCRTIVNGYDFKKCIIGTQHVERPFSKYLPYPYPYTTSGAAD